MMNVSFGALRCNIKLYHQGREWAGSGNDRFGRERTAARAE